MKNLRNSRIRRNTRHSNVIVSHIENNLREYLIVSIIFIIGILIGVIFINNLTEVKYQEINSYINNFVESLQENNNISEMSVLKNSLINNLSIGVLIWILSSTVIGIFTVYIIICFKGFCLGYTISALISILGVKSGSIFAISSMLLQNFIAIPCFIALGVSGTRLYKAIMKDRNIENIKNELIGHTIFCIFIFVLIAFSCILEAYISKKIAIYFISSL